MENRHRLRVLGITYNQIETGVYALILEDEDTGRRLPIVIGQSEAQSIQCRLQNIRTPRPLTHDLMIGSLQAFDIRLQEVMLHRLPTGVFAADLLLVDNTGRNTVIDSRSSDAVALALRVDAPIYTSEDVLAEAAHMPEEKNVPQSAEHSSRKGNPSGLESMSVEQLNQAMERAVEAENYEEAARIKAELERRK